MIELNDSIWQTTGWPGKYAPKEIQILLKGKGNIREHIEILADDLSCQLT